MFILAQWHRPLKDLILDLPEEERAHLAASLLDSLLGILSDQDDGVATSIRSRSTFE